LKWLSHFIECVELSQTNKVILIMDGHSSAAIEFARSNGVVMICLPPHPTHTQLSSAFASAGGEVVATDNPLLDPTADGESSPDDGEAVAAADAGVDTTVDGEPHTGSEGVATTTADAGAGLVAATSNSQLPISNSPVRASVLI
jgi:hypothetical protein